MLPKYSIEYPNENSNGALKPSRYMFMTQKLLTAMSCRINFLKLSISKEYLFSTLFRMQPDLTHYDFEVLHLDVAIAFIYLEPNIFF